MSGAPRMPVLTATARRGVALALLTLLTACTTLESASRPRAPNPPTGGVAPPPGEVASRPQSDTAGATQALLTQSRAARAAGSYVEATAAIERALRIAPSDPALWLELGEIELASGDPAQAATLARKALTLAADDRTVSAEAHTLLRAAGGR